MPGVVMLFVCCRNKDTFPRLADPLGYVDKDDIFHAIKAIVAAQRDYGRRDDRKQVGRQGCDGRVLMAGPMEGFWRYGLRQGLDVIGAHAEQACNR